MTELTISPLSNLSERPGQVPLLRKEQTAEQSASLDPISAVTAPDPYPYYRSLIEARPLYYDARLKLWVASGADQIRRILEDSVFRVRPLDQAVPPALAGSRAGEIFVRLVRMRDGVAQAPLKQAVYEAFAPVERRQVILQSMAWSEHLLQVSRDEAGDPGRPDIALRLPIYNLGSLLGISSSQLPRVVRLLDDFAGCIVPGADDWRIARARAAAEALWELFQDLLREVQFPSHCNPFGQPSSRGLMSGFARAVCKHAGHDEAAIIANAIGFLFQSYEATAGLIGNALIALARHPDLATQAREDPARLEAILREVLRYDPPIQNTRRFLAEDRSLQGAEMKAGDAVLLLLAAANRDPAANVRPALFDPARRDPVFFTFSAGAHRCPGGEMAIAMACGAVQQVLASQADLSALTREVRYRPSQNARVPLLTW